MSEEAIEQSCECEEGDAGAPAWVMTFADLMSLLMCFFVLLLSFSEIEATKFKQMAGSMKMAFGVQREIEAPDIPKGTSIIMQEFSPGKPDPTPLKIVQQTTFDEMPQLEPVDEDIETEQQAQEIEQSLAKEIQDGLVEVERADDRIIIRIREKGSFPSGSDELNYDFIPALTKIRDKLAEIPGRIVVTGHTDNIPISTYRFRSNWDLSAARAGSVLHHLLTDGVVDPSRVELKGLAETEPLVPNDTPANRAKNRRVEIAVIKGEAPLAAPNEIIEAN